MKTNSANLSELKNHPQVVLSEGKSKFLQGRYFPRHPEKFEGDLQNIIFRSSWELMCLEFFDNNVMITKVLSEEIVIPYFNPIKRRPARYYPDFYIEAIDATTKSKTKYLIEVKPINQVVEQRKENTYAKLTRVVNMAKWEAASKWCKERGVKFQFLTEKQIYGF